MNMADKDRQVLHESAERKDRQVLRELAEKVAEIASLPVQKEKAGMWKRLNRLEKVKPMVWINEIPWHEMGTGDELELTTGDAFLRGLEYNLRLILYQWKHMPCDMVVEPKIYCPYVIRDTGFGIEENVDIVKTDERNSVVSRHFNIQIRDEDDLEKIRLPEVTYDAAATDENYRRMADIFDGILHVEKIGTPGFWFAPWDELIRWWGVQEAMIDLIERPELVHKAMNHLVNAYLHRLDQYEGMNLLALNHGNYRIGSGGLGYTDQLPQPDYDPQHIRACDLWGCATAQIFSDVSPGMHEEFALQYELRWMKRFGLNYYGCCEPLHRKIHILEKIPNLRKISMSRWVNVEEAASKIGDRYVFSYKPNPALLAADEWNPDEARCELETVLKKAEGCIVEIIMKDISTVRYRPQHLWEWAEIAARVTEKYA